MDHPTDILAPHRPVRLAALARTAGLAVALLFLLNVSPASATVDIQGGPDHLRLNVQNASITEILNALRARFKVTYKLQSQTARALTVTYSGTLREILTRVLDGNDYILQLSDGGCKILILGASPAKAQTPPSSRVTAAPARPISPAPAEANPLPSVSSPPPLSNFLSQNRPAALVDSE